MKTLKRPSSSRDKASPKSSRKGDGEAPPDELAIHDPEDSPGGVWSTAQNQNTRNRALARRRAAGSE